MARNWNIYRLSLEVLKDRDTCLEWCRQRELILREKMCSKCNKKMTFQSDHGLGRFRCRRDHSGKGEINVSAVSNTWFENVKISPSKVLLLTYAFATDMSYELAIRESSLGGETTSNATVYDWYSYCRECCLIALERKYETEGQIGGEGHRRN